MTDVLQHTDIWKALSQGMCVRINTILPISQVAAWERQRHWGQRVSLFAWDDRYIPCADRSGSTETTIEMGQAEGSVSACKCSAPQQQGSSSGLWFRFLRKPWGGFQMPGRLSPRSWMTIDQEILSSHSGRGSFSFYPSWWHRVGTGSLVVGRIEEEWYAHLWASYRHSPGSSEPFYQSAQQVFASDLIPLTDQRNDWKSFRDSRYYSLT